MLKKFHYFIPYWYLLCWYMEYQYCNIAILLYWYLKYWHIKYQYCKAGLSDKKIQQFRKLKNRQYFLSKNPNSFQRFFYYFNYTEYDWTTKTGIVSDRMYTNMKIRQFNDLPKKILTIYYFYSTICWCN